MRSPFCVLAQGIQWRSDDTLPVRAQSTWLGPVEKHPFEGKDENASGQALLQEFLQHDRTADRILAPSQLAVGEGVDTRWLALANHTVASLNRGRVAIMRTVRNCATPSEASRQYASATQSPATRYNLFRASNARLVFCKPELNSFWTLLDVLRQAKDGMSGSYPALCAVA